MFRELNLYLDGDLEQQPLYIMETEQAYYVASEYVILSMPINIIEEVKGIFPGRYGSFTEWWESELSKFFGSPFETMKLKRIDYLKDSDCDTLLKIIKDLHPVIALWGKRRESREGEE
jgi:hypothetical protein